MIYDKKDLVQAVNDIDKENKEYNGKYNLVGESLFLLTWRLLTAEVLFSIVNNDLQAIEVELNT